MIEKTKSLSTVIVSKTSKFSYQELEIGLENNDIDLVVHSLKDLPSTLPENMVIGAIMERVDPRDTVIMKKGSENKSMSLKSLNDLSKGSVLGTSAVRRGAQLRAAYPDLGISQLFIRYSLWKNCKNPLLEKCSMQ